MSRVRFLNVPKECTESMLKTHLTTNLPASAPPIDITDCFLKRGSDGKSVRMAFVGFKTSAAGHFVVKYFNGTFFRNCKLFAEIATGLNETSLTKNLKKKQEFAAEKGFSVQIPSYIKSVDAGAEVDQPTMAKRARDNDDEYDGLATTGGESLGENKTKDRKKEFVDERVKTAQGDAPTWSGEILLPEAASAIEETDDDEESSIRAASRHHQPFDNVLQSARKEIADEEAALAKQQALGNVGDMDFLAAIGGGNAAAAPVATTNPLAHSSDDDEGGVEQNVVDEKFTPNPIGKMKGQQKADPSPADIAADADSLVQRTRRLLVRGLPFAATEDEVKNFFSSKVGPVESVHVPLTRDTKQSKGCAFVKFVSSDDAVNCLHTQQGGVLMGRLIKLFAVDDDPYAKKAAETAAKLAAASGSQGVLTDVKAKKAEQRLAADASGVSANAAYMNMHTAVSGVAKKLGVATSDIVSVEQKGAAVRAAVAEAFLTSEVKAVLGDEGIDLEALQNGAAAGVLKPRSNTTILVKNLSPSADLTALSKLFLKFGSLDATAIPSSGAFALFRFLHAQDARVAFQRNAYKPFCGQPLFLEWAPVGSLRDGEDIVDEVPEAEVSASAKKVGEDAAAVPSKLQHFTLYVTNLPFSITEEEWVAFLQDHCPRLAQRFSVQVPRVQLQADKGRCFLTCQDESTFKYIMSRLHNRSYSGRALSCVASKSAAAPSTANGASASAPEADDEPQKGASNVIAKRTAASDQVPPGCNPLKLIVKNLPFEATEKDLRELVAAFTDVKAVRVPKKVNQFGAHRENNHRGFGFVEFLTEQECTAALKALSSTHLYGRHLVLQYAKMGSE